jgi:hypothetical protein
MKRLKFDLSIARVTIVLLAIVAILVIATGSRADYQIVWSTIDGGGGQSSGGQYVLTGTIGQPDADWSRAGDYELLGGFWPGGPLCFVDFGDFARFAELWLSDDLSGDLDSDEDIDFGDLQSLTDYWLLDCPYKWPLR